MISDFFIWCAGSDQSVLEKCEDSVRTKHVGLGTMVLIPACLGLVSMSFALSTVGELGKQPQIYIGGGIMWALVIFAFDRYIVSTHRKQQQNYREFLNLNFYLRIFFSAVLGILISHPFVLFYFNSSLVKQIRSDKDSLLRVQAIEYRKDEASLHKTLDSLNKEKACWAKLLSEEISGIKDTLPCGATSGIVNITGTFPRTKIYQSKVDSYTPLINAEQDRINRRDTDLIKARDLTMRDITVSTNYDYMALETALGEIKNKYPIVAISEFFIILGCMLVDILPLVFKTFSPFTMYDKILVDDIAILKELNIKSRADTLQKAYDNISGTYQLRKKLDPEKIKDYIDNHSFSRNILMGFGLGIAIAVFFYFHGNVNPSNNQLFSVATILTILIAVISNLVTDQVKSIDNDKNESK